MSRHHGPTTAVDARGTLAARAVALAMLGAAAAACPLLAQEAGGRSGAGTILAFWGLSVPGVLLFFLGIFVLQGFCVHFGVLVAGLRGSYFRALLTIFAAVLLLIPFVLVARMVASQASADTLAVASSIGYFTAQVAAIKWLYGAPWARAALGYLAAAVLNGVSVTVLLALMF